MLQVPDCSETKAWGWEVSATSFTMRVSGSLKGAGPPYSELPTLACRLSGAESRWNNHRKGSKPVVNAAAGASILEGACLLPAVWPIAVQVNTCPHQRTIKPDTMCAWSACTPYSANHAGLHTCGCLVLTMAARLRCLAPQNASYRKKLHIIPPEPVLTSI